MKKLIALGGVGIALVLCAVLYGTYNTNVYHEQGGDKLVVTSSGEIENSGELEVQSGGEVEFLTGSTLDVQSGTTFTQAAAVTMSGAQTVTGNETHTTTSKETYQTGTELEMQSGATLDIQSGVTATLANTTTVSGDLTITGDVSSSGTSKHSYATGTEIETASGSTVDLQAGTLLTETRYAGNQAGLLKRLVRSEFDFSVDGAVSGAYDLGEDLPAYAIVTQNYFQIITQFADDGAGTVAISCASANDLFSAADITGSAGGTITAGVATGVASTMFDVGDAACDLTVTLNDVTYSAGKLVHWVEYVITE
jgi:hypothetical protein